MTGITKDELMQMAREAGASPLIGISSTLLFSPLDIERLCNDILERAAVELEGALHTAEAVESIRALKINTGD